MPSTEKRTSSLSAKRGGRIDAQVASGAHAAASEVARAGLPALQERAAAVERRLREEVAPAHDARKADPSRRSRPDKPPPKSARSKRSG